MSKFTPGPWSFKDGFDLCVGPVDDPEGKAIAIITGNPEEAFDNARLIAASPNMLLALEELLVAVREYTNDARLAIPCGVARAAIDQAKGPQ